MNLEQFKEIIFQNFINDAKGALYSWRKHGRGKCDQDASANSFGGDLAKLPDCISFWYLEELISEHEENIGVNP